jgi:hypothetical protein
MEYDFLRLSPLDFELLVKDLLQEEWEVPLESFATGRDSGIDLRYLPAQGGATIVQCKRFDSNNFAGLKSHLSRVELPKIQALAPKRYVVATSVRMTPGRKDELVDALRPFLQGPADVLGPEQLNGYLRRHPGVERAHLKLWLTSTAALEAVLDAVINRDIGARTQALLEDAQEQATLFVSHDGVAEAMRMLHEERVCIISGAPGVGKTMLAKMLLMSLTAQYQPVVLTNILEADKLYEAGTKQAFFFDDFLGTVSLAENLGRNQDAYVADFVHRIRRTPGKRLIMTTREYLLKEASDVYSRLRDNMEVEMSKYVLDIEKYSRLARAHMLYNHLFFGPLFFPVYQCLLADRGYIGIIDHPNFTPRLLESIVNLAQMKELRHEEFCSFAKEVLDRPTQLWAHAYEVQLSELGRAILVALLTLPAYPPSTIDVVKRAAARLSADDEDSLEFQRSFEGALRVLEPIFVRLSRPNERDIVSFSSPSVRDFMLGEIEGGRLEILGLLRRATYFEQAGYLLGVALERESNDQTVIEALDAFIRTFTLRRSPIRRLSCEAQLAIVLKIAPRATDPARVQSVVDMADAIAAQWRREEVDYQDALALLASLEELDAPRFREVRTTLEASAQTLFLDDLQSSWDFAWACRLKEVRPDLMNVPTFETDLQELYEREAEQLSRLDEPEDVFYVDELRSLVEDMEVIEGALGITNQTSVDHARELLGYFDREEDEDGYHEREREPVTEDEDEAIDDMFSTLGEEPLG